MKTPATCTLRPYGISAVIFVLLLSACSAPKRGPVRLINVEGRSNCQVYGGWDRYTWTGTCEEGYAAGYGELRGYSGSTEMRVYTGQVKRGVMDGAGTLTVQTDGIGPITMTGTFRNGAFISGTEVTQRDGYTRVHENGVQVRSYSTASSNASSGSELSTFAAVLGGVAQGVAASRGAAAPATQPLPKSYTPTPTPSVAQSPYTASRATPAPASAPLSGVNSSANKKTAQLANECLNIKQDSISNAGISTEAGIMLNSCNEKVSYLYCVDSSNGGGHFSCRKGNFGAGDIRAHGGDTFSVMGANNPLRVHWFACTDGDGLLSSRTVRYENGAMRGTCR